MHVAKGRRTPLQCGAAEHDTRGARSSVRRRGAVIVLLPDERVRKEENESLVLPLSVSFPLPLNLFRLYPRNHSRFIPMRHHPQRAYHAPLMPNRLTSRMIILLPHALLPPSALIRAALIVIFSIPIRKAEAILPRLSKLIYEIIDDCEKCQSSLFLIGNIILQFKEMQKDYVIFYYIIFI